MSESDEGQLQDYSVDQLAGAIVLVLGAVASLLLVVWQSKCHCKVNLCYIFQCERRPPNEEELKTLKDQAKKLKQLKDKDKKDKKDNDPEDPKPLSRQSSTVSTQSEPSEPEPEPELLPPASQ